MKNSHKLVIVAALVVFLTASAPLTGSASEDSAELWVMQTELTLTNTSEDSAVESTIVRMPLVAGDTLYGRIVREDFPVEAEEITQTDHQARMGVFEIDGLEPGESTTLIWEYHILPAAGEEHSSTPGSAAVDSVTDSEIAIQARILTAGLRDDGKRFEALQKFTHNHIEYEENSKWRNGDALQAFRNEEGVCEDYAALLVALADAAGIPSRMVYGYRRSPGSDNWVRHAWVEYRPQDGKWRSADPTFHSSPGLDQSADYMAQWYEDHPFRVRHEGGTLSGSLQESITAVQISDDEQQSLMRSIKPTE